MYSGICPLTHCQLGSTMYRSMVAEQNKGIPLLGHTVVPKTQLPACLVLCHWSELFFQCQPLIFMNALAHSKREGRPLSETMSWRRRKVGWPAQALLALSLPSPSLTLTWRTDGTSWYDLSEVRCAQLYDKNSVETATEACVIRIFSQIRDVPLHHDILKAI